MGSATAYYLLRKRSDQSVLVIERDPTYQYSSTLLCEGNVRIQFNLEENIRISQYGLEVLASFADEMTVGEFRPDPGVRRQGNLFLIDEAGREAAEAGLELQHRLGCDVRWLTPDDIARSYPPFASDQVVGATFGPDDGSVDPNAVLRGYRAKAIDMGAEFREGEVSSITASGGQVQGVAVSDGRTFESPIVVNAAGAWAPGLVEPLGVELPVVPVMRTSYVLKTDLGLGSVLPSAFLPSGVYLIAENEGVFNCGWSRPDDPVGFDFTYSRERFYNIHWPELVEWLPAFERLDLLRAWAGLYDTNTLDSNAILGEWPTLAGLYIVTGFSGHGFQQCHAVGRYIAELILKLPVSIDLSRLGPERVIEGRPLFENAARIL